MLTDNQQGIILKDAIIQKLSNQSTVYVLCIEVYGICVGF